MSETEDKSRPQIPSGEQLFETLKANESVLMAEMDKYIAANRHDYEKTLHDLLCQDEIDDIVCRAMGWTWDEWVVADDESHNIISEWLEKLFDTRLVAAGLNPKDFYP
jgi:hypothetical protein